MPGPQIAVEIVLGRDTDCPEVGGRAKLPSSSGLSASATTLASGGDLNEF
jgi:hypothetical protein